MMWTQISQLFHEVHGIVAIHILVVYIDLLLLIVPLLVGPLEAYAVCPSYAVVVFGEYALFAGYSQLG
jgi:hypothetical protein